MPCSRFPIFSFLIIRPPPRSILFLYTTLFRSGAVALTPAAVVREQAQRVEVALARLGIRSEEHTSELQSHSDLVCRLLLEKKKPLDKCAQANLPLQSVYPALT